MIPAGPFVELKAGIRIDLGERRLLRHVSQGDPQIGVANGSRNHHLISVGLADQAALLGSGPNPGIVREESLAEAEGDRWQPQPLGRRDRQCRFRRIDSHPSVERIGGSEQIRVIEPDLIAPPAQVVVQPRCDVAVDGYKRRDEVEGDVVRRHLLEGSVYGRGQSTGVAIQIVPSRRLPQVVETRHQRKMSDCSFRIVIGIRSVDGAKLALPDQSIAEVRIEATGCRSGKPRKLQIVGGGERRQTSFRATSPGMSLIRAAWHTGRIVKVGNANRH